MTMDYVTLRQIAERLGMPRSNARKYILSQGFEPMKIRTQESGGQIVFALTPSDADLVVGLREQQGFGITPRALTETDSGFFYVVQVVPDLDPRRVKLGFASDPERRLGVYRCLSPTATLMGFWACRATWECAAIASVTRSGCTRLGIEVYQVDSTDDLLARASAFFALMPDE